MNPSPVSLGATMPLTHPAVEVIPASSPRPPLVISCEHASNHLPPPWRWPEEDLRLVEMHWAYDLGIAPLVRRLAAATGAPAVLARFTRLLVDPNRPVDSDTLFRKVADGQPVRLNADLTEAEQQRRLEGFHAPYHRALDAVVAATPDVPVLGMHSFTDVYEGQPREVQIGVLYDRDPDLAERWYVHLSRLGYDTRLNEPWSGLDGLMYSPQRHATRHGRKAIELEIRQDLLADERHVARLVEGLVDTIRALHG